MRESKIEAHFKKLIEGRGGECRKFVSPGRRSVTDQIALRPIEAVTLKTADGATATVQAEVVSAIIAHFFRFVELKATGKKPTDAQLREHARMRALGFHVDWINSIEGAEKVAREMMS